MDAIAVGSVTLRPWQPSDRETAAQLIAQVLAEYGLGWEPEDADRDVIEVEQAYWQTGGVFWVLEQGDRLVGTGAFYPLPMRGEGATEIRKMYLLPEVRGQGLGRALLQRLEQAIAEAGYRQIWIETSSLLKEAVRLYESAGYQPATEVHTQRCDRVYCKSLSS
ncbi:GNAT family N-acetyltransferase [Synechococcus elongatus]|uniref:GNAT family N-acetyltransferase n=1 Tax=Synechococcus elongatus TaxID=32046 RepID=UPI0030FE12BB